MHRTEATVWSLQHACSERISKKDRSEVETELCGGKDFVAFKNGTPVKLTITINNTPGYLYLYWNGEQNGLVVTNAAPQA